MPARNLHIASNLSLPIDFITSTQAILAKKRVGKTYAAQVLAEELLAAGQQVVVIDVTSAWWGLRSSADGRTAGYPITIFGGRHGDLPLEATAGEALANAIVNDKFSAVLDVRLLKKGQRLRFIADFLETLYDKNTEAMHLFLDEADAYIPQQTFGPEQARALGAGDELVRRGGIGGIGVTLISQRPAVLNNNVLSQVDMLTVLRMNHPADLKQVKNWIVEHVDADRAKEMMASLPGLARGQAWVWAPEMKIFERVAIRAKRTYDSGRTPKVGERVRAPKVLAKVDLERLGATIAATVEQAKANDPKTLKARVAVLEKQLATKQAPKITTETKIIEKSIVKPADLKRFEAIAKRLDDRAEDIRLDVSRLGVEITTIKEVANRVTVFHKQQSSPQTGRQAQSLPTVAKIAPHAGSRAGSQPRSSGRNANVGVQDVTPGETGPSGERGRAELKILEACAWSHAIGLAEPANEVVAFLAGYTVNGHYTNIRGKLRTAGLIEYPSGGTIRLTEAGAAAAPPVTRPTTNDELHRAVLERLDTAKRKLLVPLIEAWPNALANAALADRAGYTVNGHYTNMRGRLHTMNLIEYPRAGEVRAADLLFPEKV